MYSFLLKTEIENINFITASLAGKNYTAFAINMAEKEVEDLPAPCLLLLRLSWLNSSILKPIIIFGAINIKQNK